MPMRAPLRLALAAAAVVATGCAEERERLSPPSVVLLLDEDATAPGDTVKGRVIGVDRTGGISRLAVRLCIDTGFTTLRINPNYPDSIGFRFGILVPESTPQNALVIVEGSVNDAQGFSMVVQDTIVARSPGVPVEPPPRQPSCDRPGVSSR